MGPAPQGKLDAKQLIALCFTLAFFGFFFYASIPHVHRPDWRARQRAELKALDAAVELPPSRPHRADTFILISAGQDGQYGTADDICNFEWKYREP